MRITLWENCFPLSLRSKPFHFQQWLVSLIEISCSHERIREMEHELFQSRLKPLVDATLLPKTIRSSSSGESPHYTAAMALIFGRSIQERRERVFTNVESTRRSDPTIQPRSSEAPDISIPQVQSPVRTPAPTPAPAPAPTSTPTPTPAPQLPSPSLPNPSVDFSARPASPTVKGEASLDSLTLSARKIPVSNYSSLTPGRKNKKGYKRSSGGASGQGTVPQAAKVMSLPSAKDVVPPPDKDVVPPPDGDAMSPPDKNVDPPPSEDIMQLACWGCNVKQLRNNLRSDLYCNVCFGPAAVMKCVGCGTMRVRDTEACTNCGGRFE